MDQDLSLNRLHDILSINLDFSFYKSGPKFKIKKQWGKMTAQEAKICENTTLI